MKVRRQRWDILLRRQRWDILLRNDVGIRRQATKYDDHLMIVHFLMSGYDKLHSSVPVERLVSVAGRWPHSVTCYFEWKQEKQWWKVTLDRRGLVLSRPVWERKRNRPRGLWIRLFACNKAWKEAREKTRNDWLWTFSGSSWKTKWGKEVYLFCERSLSFPAWLQTSFLLWYTTHRDEGDGIQRKKNVRSEERVRARGGNDESKARAAKTVRKEELMKMFPSLFSPFPPSHSLSFPHV